MQVPLQTSLKLKLWLFIDSSTQLLKTIMPVHSCALNTCSCQVQIDLLNMWNWSFLHFHSLTATPLLPCIFRFIQTVAISISLISLSYFYLIFITYWSNLGSWELYFMPRHVETCVGMTTKQVIGSVSLNFCGKEIFTNP